MKRIVKEKTSVITPVFCPCGNKRNSSIPHKEAYEPNSSPDKGGVCLIIPSLSTVICSLHLAGTNKYDLAEEFFDRKRIDQLNMVYSKLKESDSNFDKYHKFVLGDLNFRCEKCCNIEAGDKSRGGKDFKAIHDVIIRGDSEEVYGLFENHDRLVRLLESHNEKEAVPSLLTEVIDLVAICNSRNRMEGRRQEHEIVLPTFTMKFNEHKQHVYSDKRTPGWPDRMLVSASLFSPFGMDPTFQTSLPSITKVSSCPDVTSSDHIPLYSYLTPVHFP